MADVTIPLGPSHVDVTLAIASRKIRVPDVPTMMNALLISSTATRTPGVSTLRAPTNVAAKTASQVTKLPLLLFLMFSFHKLR